MSLATRFFLLTLVVALPIFAIVVGQEVQLRSTRRADIVQDTTAAATLAATRQARVLSAAKSVLALAALNPAVRTQEPGTCTQELARLVATVPGIGTIASVSPNGQTYCSNTTAEGQQANIADRPYFAQAVKSGDFTFSGYIVGRSSGAGNVVFAHPVKDAAGEVQAVLILPIAAAQLSPSLNDPPLPPGAFAALIDGAGIIVSRWPQPEQWVGKELRDTALGAAMGRKAKTFEEGGTEYSLVTRPVGDTGELTVAVGFPINAAIAQIREAFARSMTLMVAAFLAAAIGAWLIARVWVVRPIRNLQAAADVMASGNLAVRPPPASIPEVRALSERFVAMAQALELRLQQKDALLKEVNHRVKNSLQLVSSVLMLHRTGIDDEGTKRRFDEVAAKIATVARVHQRLYRDDNVDSLAFGAFLIEMCSDLESVFSKGPARSVRCQAEEHRLRTDVAIPLGLIVNELVTNAAKYGYPSEAPGQIRVDFRKEGDTVVASVSDDGPLPEGFSVKGSGGLGMRLISALLKQLRGTLDVVPLASGKTFVVRVPA